MYHFDGDDLATVVAISNKKSFSAAAKELRKTQAAVSFTVARLEQWLEHRLFERSSKGAEPTVHGEILIGYARRILSLESEALSKLAGAAGRGRVRLGMPDDYIHTIGTPAIEAFARYYPALQVDITCDFSRRLESLLASGDLDLAVVTRDATQPGQPILRRERQVWCAAPDALPEAISPLPLALFSDQCRARPMILQALSQAGITCRVVFSFSHITGILGAVELGRAITVLPECAVPAHLRRLGAESGLPDLPPVELAMLLPDDARSPVRALGRLLTEYSGPSTRLAAD